MKTIDSKGDLSCHWPCTSHIPHPCANQGSYYEVLNSCLCLQRSYLVPGLWNSEVYLLPIASRRPGHSKKHSKKQASSYASWTCRDLWLPASPVPDRERRSILSLQGGQTETSHPHLLHYRAKRLLCCSDDIMVLLSQLGWHQFESLPDHKVCSYKMYFQQGAFSIISDVKDKKYEAGAEVEFKIMDERNVLIVCLCQLWPSAIPFLFSPSSLKHLKWLQATGLQLLLG